MLYPIWQCDGIEGICNSVVGKSDNGTQTDNNYRSGDDPLHDDFE